ncbi:Asparagine synthetase domain-containing protein [Thalictrum thalictroides]|uniref:Asparagine synthetase domain-containing protein n=1 Tax=Thalictrum thalictroides TaxID=46969 RepID=A0A7J6VMH8_THATH|nr:Asparagine synthetase domain-containing protein [Thalictrum thalictroides]
MCGIALIISGVRIELSSLLPDYNPPLPQSQHVHHTKFSIQDIKAALQRRGPDNLGTRKIYLELKNSIYVDKEEEEQQSSFDVEEATKRVKSSICFSEKKNDCITSTHQVVQNDDSVVLKSVAELHFVGATLQLRGVDSVFQPLVDNLGNVLVYNGEIFGGLHIDRNSNDAECLMHALAKCCSCNSDGLETGCHYFEEGQISVIKLLSTIRGPWATIYWQNSSKTLWFGRDAFGRRSLLVHWPTLDDPRLLLSSVSPLSSIKTISGSEVGDGIPEHDFWEELSCGIYSLKFDKPKLVGCLVGEVRRHDWIDPELNELIKWERTYVECKSHEINSLGVSVERAHHITNSTSTNRTSSKLGVQVNCTSEHGKLCADIPGSLLNGATIHQAVSLPAHRVLVALRESVARRSIINPILKATMGKSETVQGKMVPVAVLFSGGLDSMILAALLDKCLEPCYEVDLLNVSFDKQFAPDRISARAGVKELQRISPLRRWNLVEIDADLSNLTSETEHVMSLINPSKTYMDLNIGIALWLAAGGDGWVDTGISNNFGQDCQRLKYKSGAKILLVGAGADEQCAGYSRHRTKYRMGGWLGLHEEMKLDMQRIWKRNLGRDDRCLSDAGKEARFPFLDEDVIKTLLEIPLWEVANLDQPVGRGDKKILRETDNLRKNNSIN